MSHFDHPIWRMNEDSFKQLKMTPEEFRTIVSQEYPKTGVSDRFATFDIRVRINDGEDPETRIGDVFFGKSDGEITFFGRTGKNNANELYRLIRIYVNKIHGIIDGNKYTDLDLTFWCGNEDVNVSKKYADEKGVFSAKINPSKRTNCNDISEIISELKKDGYIPVVDVFRIPAKVVDMNKYKTLSNSGNRIYHPR